MKRNKSIENAIGILLLITCIYHIIFNRPNWHEADGPVLYFPLFIGFFLIFKKEISLLVAGVLSWLAYFSAVTGVIEEDVFDFLINHGFFPSSFLEFGRPNSRYMVLILFVIVIAVLIALVSINKTRSKLRAFSLISCCGVLGFTFVIHSAIPDTLIKWNRRLVASIMEDVINSDANVQSKSNLSLMCETFHFKCALFTDEASALSLFQTEQTKAYISANIKSMIEQGVKKKTMEAGEHRSGEFYRLTVGLVTHAANQVSVLVEDNWINQSQRLGEETIGRWGLVGHFVWGWLVLFLGIFHTYPIRNRIFNTPAT